MKAGEFDTNTRHGGFSLLIQPVQTESNLRANEWLDRALIQRSQTIWGLQFLPNRLSDIHPPSSRIRCTVHLPSQSGEREDLNSKLHIEITEEIHLVTTTYQSTVTVFAVVSSQNRHWKLLLFFRFIIPLLWVHCSTVPRFHPFSLSEVYSCLRLKLVYMCCFPAFLKGTQINRDEDILPTSSDSEDTLLTARTYRPILSPS